MTCFAAGLERAQPSALSGGFRRVAGRHACAAFLWLVGSSLIAQETFVPPQAYAAERYQETWRRNPFLLQAPTTAAQRVDFAQDLAIGSYYGSKDNPTVVIVNTKTHERISLKKGQPTPNGIALKSITISPRRSETVAEITLGDETAELRYDDSFVKLTASQGKAQPGPKHTASQEPQNADPVLSATMAALTRSPAADILPASYPNLPEISQPAGGAPSPPGRRRMFQVPVAP